MITIEGVDPRMIANNIEPNFATHPGELIKDELEYRGVSQRQLAADMGVSYSVLNDIVNGKRAVNTEYALLLEAAMGIPVDMWLNLQREYDKFMAKRNASFLEKLKRVRRIAAVL